jgi:hypothetical protein
LLEPGSRARFIDSQPSREPHDTLAHVVELSLGVMRGWSAGMCSDRSSFWLDSVCCCPASTQFGERARFPCGDPC